MSGVLMEREILIDAEGARDTDPNTSITDT